MFANFGHQFIVFCCGSWHFRGVEDSGENCVRCFCGISANFRTVVLARKIRRIISCEHFSTRTFTEHVEHLLSSVVVRILCSLCSILHLFIRLNKPHNEELLEVPANSPDLNVCDYYLWKAIQERLQPRYGTRVELRADVLRQAVNLPLEEIWRSICSWPHRLLKCHMAGGGHFEG